MREHLVHAVRVVVRWRERQRICTRLRGVSGMAKRQRGRAIADVGDDRHAARDLLDRRLNAACALGFGQPGEFAGGAHRPDPVYARTDQKVHQATQRR